MDEATRNTLEELHTLSMKMEEMLSDLSQISDIDLSDITSSVEGTTFDIQTLLDEEK